MTSRIFSAKPPNCCGSKRRGTVGLQPPRISGHPPVSSRHGLGDFGATGRDYTDSRLRRPFDLLREDGSGTWTRTKINGSKGHCATNCTIPDPHVTALTEIASTTGLTTYSPTRFRAAEHPKTLKRRPPSLAALVALFHDFVRLHGCVAKPCVLFRD